ncbi:unnamed protein product [Caenorhabditis sp. 36 PRJEB53466]|nr:unnamed protein product [Caenorhabditis sp. 36 PRJEB53466]
MYAVSEKMSFREQDDSSVRRSAAGGKEGKKKKKTAHFKKRGHPAFKVMFIVCSLLTVLSIIMACVATIMMVIA